MLAPLAGYVDSLCGLRFAFFGDFDWIFALERCMLSSVGSCELVVQRRT